MTRHMTVPELRQLAQVPGLTKRQRQVATLRAEGVQAHIIGHRLGISTSAVTSVLAKARQRSVPGRTVRAMGKPIDEAWHERQVAYVRSLEADPEHQGRYLRGIAYAHGDAVAARVEREAK
jgi:DNA-binding CsgD family transcriptional regulator